MTQQIEIVLVQPQRLPHLLYLFHKMLRRPQTAVIGLIAIVGLQLIILDELYPLLRQKILKRLEEFMRATRSPMQQQDLDPRIIAESLGPYMKFPLGVVISTNLIFPVCTPESWVTKYSARPEVPAG